MPQYELNLRDYWQIIRKRYLALGVIFFAVLIPSILYTNIQKPVYQAMASVQWIERRTMGGLLTDLVSVNKGDPMVAQSRIITSIPVLEKVAMELGLVSEHASPTEIMEMAVQLQGAVSTNILGGTNMIHIIVTHGNPQMAANIANKVAEIYIGENLREKTKESRAVREFIEGQLAEITAKLKGSEEELARFKEIEVPSGVGLPLQDRLADLDAKQQELSKQYTELHPDVKDIKEQIKQVKEQLRALPQKELQYNRLIRETEINANLYRELKDKLEAARITEAAKIEDVNIVDRAVPAGSPVSPNKRLTYFTGAVMGLILGVAGTFIMEQLDTSIGTIDEVESLLQVPVLGVTPYLKTREEKERNFLEKIWPKKQPRGKDKLLRLRNQLLIYYAGSSPIFESYRMLRTNIQTHLFKEKKKGNILLLTSSGPEEGKSITVSNLSIAMAQGGLRTLLIDADMRRAVIHNIFGIKDREPGLCDILRQTVQYKDAIRTFTDILMGEIGFDETLKTFGLDNLYILTSGSLPVNPAELLASAEMTNLLQSLKAEYDLILIDSPPIMTVADAAILAPKSDGVILVYQVGKIARTIVNRAKIQIMNAGAPVKGVVLNNISPQVEMRYGSYYYYKYYGKYYTPEQKEKT
jgi:Mrp family chromosome partitioning ATPase/uncharacterized protein involved in exopolysaccharide biosynthesis